MLSKAKLKQLKALCRKVVRETEDEWFTKHGLLTDTGVDENKLQQMLRDKTVQLLDKWRDDTILQVLGLRIDTWNRRVEVDHCNGRMSALRDAIQDEAQGKLQGWLAQVEWPPMTPQVAKGLVDEYQDSLKRAAQESARKWGQTHAAQAVELLLKPMLEEEDDASVED